MSIYYLSKYFNSENKSFIEFTPLGYKSGVFQRLGLFRAIKIDKNLGGLDSKIVCAYAALSLL